MNTFTVTLDIRLVAAGGGVAAVEQLINGILERHDWVKDIALADISQEVEDDRA